MFFLFALLNQNMLTLGNFTFINVPKGSLCLSLLPRSFRHESLGAGSEGRTGKDELLFFLCDQTSDSRNSREERLTWAPGFMRILWGNWVALSSVIGGLLTSRSIRKQRIKVQTITLKACPRRPPLPARCHKLSE